MRVAKIDHVQLAMPAEREAEAIAFYDGLLGLALVPKPANLAARGGCWFERDGVKLHLGVDADFRPARKAHPALLVEDLPARASMTTSRSRATIVCTSTTPSAIASS